MVWIVSRHASPVDPYRAWFVLFHVMFHWFIITWHGLYCLTSCFTGSSLLGMVSLFEYTPLWFFLTGHDLYCFTSCFRGSFFSRHDLYCFTSLIGTSLLGMVCFVSLHASLVHHHWAWFVLLDYELHWIFLTWYGLYFFTSKGEIRRQVVYICIMYLSEACVSLSY